MKLSVKSASTPTLSEYARDGLGWHTDQLPEETETLRASVIADSIRMGLFTLFSSTSPPEPVHNLKLRGWLKHKLEPIVPDLFDSNLENYRQILIEGRGGNLGFLGDVLELSQGYVCPAPTRLVESGTETYLLISGRPTKYIDEISDRVRHYQFGRRIEGISKQEVKSAGFRVQNLDAYLGEISTELTPSELIFNILSIAGEPGSFDPNWEVYLGNQEANELSQKGVYGFGWGQINTPDANRGLVVEHERKALSIWKRPLTTTDRFRSYWLKEQSGAKMLLHPLDNVGWRRACLALDNIAHKPRHALIVNDPATDQTALRLSFPPFRSLAKVLFAFGGKLNGRRGSYVTWTVPKVSLSLLTEVLQRSGIALETIER